MTIADAGVRVSGWILPEDLPAEQAARLRSRALASRVAGAAQVQLPAQRMAPTAERGHWVVPPPRSAPTARPLTVEAAGATAQPAPATAGRSLPAVDLVDAADQPDGAADDGDEQQQPQPTSPPVSVPTQRGTVCEADEQTRPRREVIRFPIALAGPRVRTLLRRTAIAGTAAALVAVCSGAPTFGEDTKTVTVIVDGKARTVTTIADSVGQALNSAGLQVGEHDVIVPGPATAIGQGSVVSLQRGRSVTLTVDGRQQQFWTTATTVQEAIAQLGLNPADYQLSTDRRREIGTDGLALSGARLRDVTVIDGTGSPRRIRSAAKDVETLLRQQKIRLSATDRVSPAGGSPLVDGERIVVTRVTVSDRTVDAPIPQPKPVVVENPQLGRGNTAVTTPGRDGKRSTTLRTTTINGKATERVIATAVVVKPQRKVTSVGTKETGAPESWSVPWDKMAFCESTSRWDVNTGNGTYGGLQFMTSTWLQYGGGEFAPRADLATKEQQIIVAERLYAKEGLAPWHCARLLGWGFGKYTG